MEDIYRIVGQLYLNSRLELENVKRQAEEIVARERQERQQVEGERDELLRLLATPDSPDEAPA